jgi:hypothetical protein
MTPRGNQEIEEAERKGKELLAEFGAKNKDFWRTAGCPRDAHRRLGFALPPPLCLFPPFFRPRSSGPSLDVYVRLHLSSLSLFKKALTERETFLPGSFLASFELDHLPLDIHFFSFHYTKGREISAPRRFDGHRSCLSGTGGFSEVCGLVCPAGRGSISFLRASGTLPSRSVGP